MKTVTLNNGVVMPQIGYGVYQVSPSECERCVSDALAVGYRMIYTAQAYANEQGVGAAVKKSGIPRDELFLVSKIWIANYGYEKAKKSIDESLRKLGTDYIDLIFSISLSVTVMEHIAQWKKPTRKANSVQSESATSIPTILSTLPAMSRLFRL